MNLSTTTRHLLRLSIAAALTVTSLSATAQSQEYRRGYDQGYRDGQAAGQGGVRGGYQDRNDGRFRIEIDQAEYGVRGAFCDARPAVRQAVGRGSNFSVTASNNLCGDPAPSARKRLTVTYRCGNGGVLRAQADEGDALTLGCQ
jgi:hypothetical protein